MKNTKIYIVFLLAFFITGLPVLAQESKKGKSDFPILKGSYLGQTPPEYKSEVFAPNFVSTKYGELNSVFTPDGREFYFSRRGVPGKPSAIMVSGMIDNVWTTPAPVNFTGTFSDIDLFITHDNKSMIFCSNRPHKKGEIMKIDHDFWISKNDGNKWAEPVLFAKEALSDFEDYFPVLTKSGNLYFNSQRESPGTNNIFMSQFVNGKYTTAKKLPEPINSAYREFDAFISYEEKMIIFSSERPDGFGRADIYVSFKKSDNSWTQPLNLGNDINSDASEYGSTISPDGKYFFYTSNKNGSEDIYWVSTEIIEDLKPKNLIK
ncbi:TolB family protein [Bacteroidota bacterium]